MTISIGGTPTSLAYTNTTTLQQMADAINANSTLNAKVSAGVVQNTTNDFRLVLTPKGSSVGETITLSDSVGGGLLSAMTSTTSTQDISSTTDGAFTLLNSLLDSYTSASNGTITNFTKATKGVTTALAADKTKAAAALTARYDTLTAKFAAYDSMISKLNNQFNALKQQIDAQALAASGG
jgi:flagellar hook-associated protein 2